MIEDFVAFDFETANGNHPCSIGVAEFKNGELINEYYSLIKPKELYFNPFAQAVHGLTLEDVINEREFPEVWGEIYPFFNNRSLVAHNYSFDLRVLNYNLDLYSLPKIDFKIDCTLKLSRRYLDLENHKLSTVAKHFNIEQDNYHNAIEDAVVCGKIYHKLITGNYDKITRSKSKGKTSINNLTKFKWGTSEKLKDIKIVVSGVFYQMSRNELKKAIEDNGGKVSSSISKKTSFIVAGDNMGPSKLTKAQDLGIEIITEQDFIDLIK